MAEVVQRNLELMVEELEEVKAAGFLKDSEIKIVLRKRKAFEYRLRRKIKQREDFVKYAQYEMNVLQLLRKRSVRLGYKKTSKLFAAPIISRIHNIFQKSYLHFPEDVKLYLSHIDFCNTKKQGYLTSKIYLQMLKTHSRKPAVWVSAAKQQAELSNSMVLARPILQRGIRFNTESKLLWQEYFRMELLFVEKIRKRRLYVGEVALNQNEDGNLSEDVLEGAVAFVVFKQAATTRQDDVEFWLSFIPICDLFNFTQKLHEGIMNHILSCHPHSELVAASNARSHLQAAQHLREDPTLAKDKKALSMRCLELEELCYLTFEDSISEMPTERMYSFYLETLFKKLELKSKKHQERRLSRAVSVVDRAADLKCLSEDMAMKWFDLLEANAQAALLPQFVILITTLFPHSARAWHLRLSHSMSVQDTYEDVNKLFGQACSATNVKEQVPLWKAMFDFLRISHPGHVDALLQSAVLSSAPEVALKAKIWWLEWTSLTKSAKKVQSLYKQICRSQPVSIELFETAINLLRAQPEVKIKQLRLIYEAALTYFGSTSIELWMSYIQLEFKDGDVTQTSQLHWRAMKALEGHLVEELTQRYTFMQTGVKQL